jgi:hypothetical protein
MVARLTEPAAFQAIIPATEAAMADHWRTHVAAEMRDAGEDEAAYVAGWTISGLATLGAIIAVWIFAL